MSDPSSDSVGCWWDWLMTYKPCQRNPMGKIEVKKRKERQPDRREEGEKGERMQMRQTR